MKACGTDYYRAKALMEDMKAMGLSPNHISWSILVDICGTSQNTKGAMEVSLSLLFILWTGEDLIQYLLHFMFC